MSISHPPARILWPTEMTLQSNTHGKHVQTTTLEIISMLDGHISIQYQVNQFLTNHSFLYIKTLFIQAKNCRANMSCQIQEDSTAKEMQMAVSAHFLAKINSIYFFNYLSNVLCANHLNMKNKIETSSYQIIDSCYIYCTCNLIYKSNVFSISSLDINNDTGLEWLCCKY